MAEEEAKGPEELPAKGDELEAGYQAALEEGAEEAESVDDAVEGTDSVSVDEDVVDDVNAPAGTELGDEDLAEPEIFEVTDEEAEELEEGASDSVDLDQLEEAEEEAAEADSPTPVATGRPARKPAASASSDSAKVPQKKNRPTRTRTEATAVDAPKRTGLGLFISQIVQELKKVVWPSSGQLWQFFIVVLVFVLFMIAFIGVLDYLFGLLVMWLFK